MWSRAQRQHYRKNKLKPMIKLEISVKWMYFYVLVNTHEYINNNCSHWGQRSSMWQQRTLDKKKRKTDNGGTGRRSLNLTHSEGNYRSRNKIIVCVCLCAQLCETKWAGRLPCLHWPAHQGVHCGKSIWIILTPNDVTHTHIHAVQNGFFFVSKLKVSYTD